MLRPAVYVAVGICAWSALAFGAVYPWAYWPLAAGSACLCGVLSGDRRVRSDVGRHALLVPLAFLFGAIGLQLVPAPSNVLHLLSPSTPPLLLEYRLPYSLNPGAHPFSIDPEATVLALVLGITLTALMLLSASLLRVVGSRELAAGLVVVGFVIALVAIVQRPLFSGRIYGFWEPEQRSNSFGPFVNPNHFAGWMAMSLSLALGLLCAQFASVMRRGARGWRDYIAWASGPSASGLMLLMTAAVTMGLSLVLSLSRSGILCFLLAVLITAHATLRKQQGIRRLVMVSYLTGLLIGVVLWVGPSTIAQEFDKGGWTQMGGRLPVWQDAASVIRAFPVAGTGLNTYGSAMLFYQRNDPTLHYTAAHNDYLQLAAEGGLLVGIPIAWAVVVLVRTIRRRFSESGRETAAYWIRVGAVTGLIAIALQEVVDFSLQIPANACLFAFLCAIAIHRVPEPAR